MLTSAFVRETRKRANNLDSNTCGDVSAWPAVGRALLDCSSVGSRGCRLITRMNGFSLLNCGLVCYRRTFTAVQRCSNLIDVLRHIVEGRKIWFYSIAWFGCWFVSSTLQALSARL